MSEPAAPPARGATSSALAPLREAARASIAQGAPPVLRLAGVGLRYRLAKHRIGSFKEYAIHLVKGALAYEELWALRDVDLEIARGEIVGVIGKNGAGKSTLLKVISRILQPTRGTVWVSGRVSPVLELGTGFDPELTGWENIKLNALLRGHSRRAVAAAMDEIVAFSGLGEFVHAPIRNYSTGMVARLGFAVATAWTPEILILDEVLAVGDAEFTARCERRMREFHDRGTTILLVSHSLEAVRESCSRCLWLDAGRVAALGAPDDVIRAYLAKTAPEIRA